MRCEELNRIPWEELIEPPPLLPLLWCFKPKQLQTSCGWRCAEWPGRSSGRGKGIPPTSSKGSVPPPALACPKSWLPGNCYLHKYRSAGRRRDLHHWTVLYCVKYEVTHNTLALGKGVVCWCGDTLEAKLENSIPSCPRSPRRCGKARLTHFAWGCRGKMKYKGQHHLQFTNSDVSGWQVPARPFGLLSLGPTTAGLARLSTAQPGLSLVKLKGGEECWAAFGSVIAEMTLANSYSGSRSSSKCLPAAPIACYPVLLPARPGFIPAESKNNRAAFVFDSPERAVQAWQRPVNAFLCSLHLLLHLLLPHFCFQITFLFF